MSVYSVTLELLYYITYYIITLKYEIVKLNLTSFKIQIMSFKTLKRNRDFLLKCAFFPLRFC